MAGNSTAEVLHALLGGLLCWAAFYVAVILPHVIRRPAAVSFVIFELLSTLAALVFLHQGSLRTASLIYLCGNWLLDTIVIILNGGIHSQAVAFYMALPISAAWLLGYWAS